MSQAKLYKYLDANGGLMMLYYKTLQFANSTQLNDPFDCHPALIDFTNVPADRTKIWPAEMIADLESNHYEQKRDKTYICSLTKLYDSIPMWAYYNNHQGICIGLDMEKTRNYTDKMIGMIIGCLEWEVQYKDVIEKPDYFRPFLDLFRYQMSTKAIEWRHEQEVRLVSYDPYPIYMRIYGKKPKRNECRDWREVRAYLDLGGNCFDSVYLGLNIADKDKKNIIKVARMCNPDIKIYQMKMDPNALRLKEELLEI